MLSKFVKVFDFDNTKVLFNTVNKSIVELNNEYFLNKKQISDNIPKEYIESLCEMGFFIDDLESKKLITEAFIKDDKLIISVETTLACNLRCPYCYQGSDKSSNVLSDQNIEYLLEYYKNVFDVAPYEEIVLKVLGGEPTLFWNIAKNIITKTYDFCKSHEIKLNLMIDTNGTQIKDIINLKEYDTILLTIPLSYKACHDQMRKTVRGEPTYDLIIQNLNILKNEKPDALIVLRYNTDHENTIHFSEYVADLSMKLNHIPMIDLSYTIEPGCGDEFKNALPFEEYQKWRVNDAIDILVNSNFYVSVSPLMTTEKCQYRSKYSMKLFSDGTIGACAIDFFKKNRISISEAVKNLEIFDDINRNVNKEIEKCKECDSFFLCAASYMLPCIKLLPVQKEGCKADGEIIIDIENFIRQYVKYQQLEKEHLFVGFNQEYSIR